MLKCLECLLVDGIGVSDGSDDSSFVKLVTQLHCALQLNGTVNADYLVAVVEYLHVVVGSGILEELQRLCAALFNREIRSFKVYTRHGSALFVEGQTLFVVVKEQE